MKQFIRLALLLLMTTTVTIAKERDIIARANPHIHASGTHFLTPPTDSRWSNTNGQSFTKAKYSNFEGVTAVKVIAYDKQVAVVLEADVKVTKGALQLQVVNSKGEIVFEKTATHNEKFQTEITLDVYEEYQIRFIGQQTKGSYYCQWTEK